MTNEKIWREIKEMDKETKKMAAQEHYRKFIKGKSKKGRVKNDNGNN